MGCYLQCTGGGKQIQAEAFHGTGVGRYTLGPRAPAASPPRRRRRHRLLPAALGARRLLRGRWLRAACTPCCIAAATVRPAAAAVAAHATTHTAAAVAAHAAAGSAARWLDGHSAHLVALAALFEEVAGLVQLPNQLLQRGNL